MCRYRENPFGDHTRVVRFHREQRFKFPRFNGLEDRRRMPIVIRRRYSSLHTLEIS